MYVLSRVKFASRPWPCSRLDRGSRRAEASRRLEGRSAPGGAAGACVDATSHVGAASSADSVESRTGAESADGRARSRRAGRSRMRPEVLSTAVRPYIITRNPISVISQRGGAATREPRRATRRAVSAVSPQDQSLFMSNHYDSFNSPPYHVIRRVYMHFTPYGFTLRSPGRPHTTCGSQTQSAVPRLSSSMIPLQPRKKHRWGSLKDP